MISRASASLHQSLLFVEAGADDDSAIRGDANHPFGTLTSAKAAAVSGDTIIVGPGTYDENDLLKTGVNWHFESGAIVQYTGDEACGIFDDGANGANGVVACKITGNGQFIFSSTYADVDETGAVHISNVSSDVSIEGDTFSNVGTTALFSAAVFAGNGTLYVRARIILTTLYGVWWKHGALRVETQQITATGEGQCIYCPSTASPVGAAFIKAQQLSSDTGNTIHTSASDANAQVWIEALEIMSNGQTCSLGGGKVYITAQKIGTTSTNASTYAVEFLGGKAWIEAEKISGKAIRAAAVAGASELRVTCQHFDEDTNAIADVISIGQSVTAFIHCMELKTVQANGLAIVHASAVCHFWGRINTLSATSKNPVSITAAGSLRLYGAVLLPNGSRDSIETTVTPTVISYDSNAKTAADGGVTVVGNFTVNASFA